MTDTTPAPGPPDKSLPPLYANTKLLRDAIIAGLCVTWVAARGLYGLTFSFIEVIFVLTVTAVLIHYAVWRGRLRRRFRENDGKLCIHCGHSLVGLDETGICPECGKTFNFPADHAAWIRTEIFTQKTRS